MNRRVMLILMIVALLLGATAAALAVGHGRALKAGAVYTMTNADDGNELVVFGRDGHGLLTLAGTIPTEGLGSGGDLDPLGSQGSLVLTDDGRWLLAVNAGSSEISVFRIDWDGPVLVDKVDSGGEFPVSVAAFHDLVYVVNAGGVPNITGFYLDYQGQLVPLDGSTRDIGSGAFAQVGFNPHGDALVVTDRGDGEILVFPLDQDGLPSMLPVTTLSNGIAPFGFVFDEKGHLLVSEAGSGAVSSYAINPDGSLQTISASVANGQGGVCWIDRNHRGYVYTANTGSQTLSVYRGRHSNGRIMLLDATTGFGNRPIDIGISVNGRFLYALDPAAEAIGMFRIEPNGALTDLGTIGGGLSIFAQGIAVR